MSTDEIIERAKLLGVELRVRDGRPVLKLMPGAERSNVPESLLVLLRRHRAAICERLAISPDAPPLPTPKSPQPKRRIVLVDTGEVLQEFDAIAGQSEQKLLAEWAKKHPGKTVAAEWWRECPLRQSTEWVRWMTMCEESADATAGTS